MSDVNRRRFLWAWLLFVAGVTGFGCVVLSVWYPWWTPAWIATWIVIFITSPWPKRSQEEQE